MVKPATLHGYSDQYTLGCERVLVTLLRGLGPWKDSVCLVGGLTPRYLVAARPPAVPAHAGKHANLVSFTCLKSFAFDQRFERKDAHDLIYCIEHAPEGSDAVADAFRKELAGKHGAVIQASLAILRNRFAHDEKTEGYRKDGPVSVARFELGESDEPEQREARALRQRQASDVIEQLLRRVEHAKERAT